MKLDDLSGAGNDAVQSTKTAEPAFVSSEPANAEERDLVEIDAQVQRLGLPDLQGSAEDVRAAMRERYAHLKTLEARGKISPEDLAYARTTTRVRRVLGALVWTYARGD